jgi:signal transduction histidine kinase
MRLRPRRGSPRPPHTRPIRSTLALLLVFPLVSLIALCGYEVYITGSQALSRHNYAVQYMLTSSPGDNLLRQLSQERVDSLIFLSAPPAYGHATLSAQRIRTDAAVAAFRRNALKAQAQGVLGAEAQQSLGGLLTGLRGLPGIRAMVDSREDTPVAAWRDYNTLADAMFAFLGSQSTSTAVDFSQQAEATLNLSLSLEMANRDGALIGAAMFAKGRTMTPEERGLFAQGVGSRRLLQDQAVEELPTPLAAPFSQILAGPGYRSVVALEDQVAAPTRATGAIPVLTPRFLATANAFLAQFDHAVTQDRAVVGVAVQQQDRRTLVQFVLTAALGLLTVTGSILLLLRFGRRLVRELTALQRAARQVAEERLPEVVEKLGQGSDVDVAAELAPARRSRTAEIELVGQALATVQRTAIELAAGQARIRRGVGQIFLNLSRRNQSLLHRQLSILDVMERGTNDPDALADLFRLDHLTTRMRRHAEGLIILSGASPARGWRDPVPVIDVIRAAVAEVEDYVRVDVLTEATDVVVGSAVADVVHLLAELIENATMFSPATTRVDVRGGRVGNGFAVEIEDRGIGMAAATMADANQRLAEPPEFDLADTDQLGLFVVGRLASRHGIRISLRDSPFGGVTAIVMLPNGLVLAEEEARAIPARGLPAAVPSRSLIPEPSFGITGRRRELPGPPEPPRFMGPAPAPQLTGPGPAPLAAGTVAQPWLAGDPPGLRAVEPRHAAGTDEPAPGAGPVAPAAANGEYRGLPRRVRQANLAPQLRQDPAGVSGPAIAATQLRSPEEARNMMAALQRGWQQGRADDGEATGQADEQAPGTAPGTGEESP